MVTVFLSLHIHTHRGFSSLLLFAFARSLHSSWASSHSHGFCPSQNFNLYVAFRGPSPILTLCCCSVVQSCLTLCDPMDCRMPGFLLRPHGLQHSRLPRPSPSPRTCSNYVHWVGDVIQPSYPLSSPFSTCLQSFPASGSFPVSRLFASGIGTSVSASVLPMNIQGWFPLGLTGLISLQSKGFSRVFSNTTVPKASILQDSAFFMVQLTHPYMTTGKTGPQMSDFHDSLTTGTVLASQILERRWLDFG